MRRALHESWYRRLLSEQPVPPQLPLKMPSILAEKSSLHTAFFVALSQAISSGYLFSQVVTYYSACQDDKRALKVYVGSTVFLGTLQTVMTWVTLFGAAEGQVITWYTRLEMLITILVVASIQPYFIRRAWLLTRRVTTTCLIVVLYIVTKSISLSALVLAFGSWDIPRAQQAAAVEALTLTAIASGLCLDASITISLLMHFRRSRIDVIHVDETLHSLMGITWRSAAPSGIAVIISFVLSVRMSTINVARFFVLLGGKLYCHSLLYALNSRPSLRARLNRGPQLGRLSVLESELRRMGILGTPIPMSIHSTHNSSSIADHHSSHSLSEDDGLSFRTSDEERGDVNRFQTLMEALQDDHAQRLCPWCSRRSKFQSFQSNTTKVGSPPQDYLDGPFGMEAEHSRQLTFFVTRPPFPGKRPTY
ncbi:hypothetical protein FRC01_003086 [Tulasnella sp. 417]|nr:hypothetical protein FRC01_003086 [Tulasnella sp. 417]